MTDETRALTPVMCAECGSAEGQILFLAIAWPGGKSFEGHVHRECQHDLVERLEREWHIKPEGR